MPVGKVRNPSVAKARGTVAGLSRSRTDDDPEYIAARQRLKELHFAEYVNKTVNAFPELTQEQIDRVAGLIRPISPDAIAAGKRTKAAKKINKGGGSEAG